MLSEQEKLLLTCRTGQISDLPRYMTMKARPPDSYVCDMVIDREKISIIDGTHYRIRVDGVWLALYNPKTKTFAGR